LRSLERPLACAVEGFAIFELSEQGHIRRLVRVCRAVRGHQQTLDLEGESGEALETRVGEYGGLVADGCTVDAECRESVVRERPVRAAGEELAEHREVRGLRTLTEDASRAHHQRCASVRAAAVDRVRAADRAHQFHERGRVRRDGKAVEHVGP